MNILKDIYPIIIGSQRLVTIGMIYFKAENEVLKTLVCNALWEHLLSTET